MPCGIDAGVIDLELVPHAGQHGIKEFQIAVTLIPHSALPTRFFALWIGQPTGRVESLRIDHDGLRPQEVDVVAAGGIAHIPTMTVKSED